MQKLISLFRQELGGRFTFDMNGLAERTRSRTENIRLPPTLPPQTRLKVSNMNVETAETIRLNFFVGSEMVQVACFWLNIKMGFTKF